MIARTPLPRLASVVAAGVTVATVILTGSAQAVAAADPEQYTITVNGAPAARPVLDELEQVADREGTTLEQAIDQYVAKVVGPGWEQHEPGYPDDVPTLPDLEIDGIHLWELEDMRLIAERDGAVLADVIDSHGWQSEFWSSRTGSRRPTRMSSLVPGSKAAVTGASGSGSKERSRPMLWTWSTRCLPRSS